jgi:hypothetical protein
MSAPREWSQERLLDLFPDVAVDPPAPVRCTAPTRGEGAYLNDSAGEGRGCARLKLEIEPAEGIVDAIVHERPALRFGRVVSRSVVHYEGSLTPVAFSIAAAMAMQDAAKRAGWDPDPRGRDEMRTFVRTAS